MVTDDFYSTGPQWLRVGIVICSPLFLSLPASILFDGMLREVLLALGFIGVGAGAILLAAHGLIYQRLPRDPLGRFPSSPGTNSLFYWATVLGMLACGVVALLFGCAGLIANFTKLLVK